MNILLIHQNFPGQFLHLAQALCARKENVVVGIGETENIKRRGNINGMTTIGYPTPKGAGKDTHHYLQNTEAAIRRGQAVVRTLLQLRQKGFVPDVIFVHPGWGEGMFIREVYPDTPLIVFGEFFFKANEADVGFDPEFPITDDALCSIRIRNISQILSLLEADVCFSPTKWQASRYPKEFQPKMFITHDGIDTDFMHPDPEAKIFVYSKGQAGESAAFMKKQASGNPLELTKKSKIVTYMARNLEPYRGYHVFMRSLGMLQKRHPDAEIVIIGGTETSYNAPLPNGKSYKDLYLDEVRKNIDLSHIHFLGKVPYPVLRGLFQISSVHVYLTYPFVLSWSLMEALACEGLVVSSRTAPVEEVIRHGENGILVDFFDREALVDAIDEALLYPENFEEIRKEARRGMVAKYNLVDCLAQQVALLEQLAKREHPLVQQIK